MAIVYVKAMKLLGLVLLPGLIGISATSETTEIADVDATTQRGSLASKSVAQLESERAALTAILEEERQHWLGEHPLVKESEDRERAIRVRQPFDDLDKTWHWLASVCHDEKVGKVVATLQRLGYVRQAVTMAEDDVDRGMLGEVLTAEAHAGDAGTAAVHADDVLRDARAQLAMEFGEGARDEAQGLKFSEYLKANAVKIRACCATEEEKLSTGPGWKPVYAAALMAESGAYFANRVYLSYDKLHEAPKVVELWNRIAAVTDELKSRGAAGSSGEK